MSGPYGVGKDTLLRAVMDEFGDSVYRVRTLTTRPSSPHQDPSYTTVNPEQLDNIVASGNWIVTHQLSDSVAYATDLDEIMAASASGRLPVHSIYAADQGAGELRRRFCERLCSIALLAAPGALTQQIDTLRFRLETRDRDNANDIEFRLKHQREPIEYILEKPRVDCSDVETRRVFDRVIINDHLELATQQVIEAAAEALDSRRP